MNKLLRTLAGVCAIGFACQAFAQWPERPIKIIVPYPAGNSSDVVARLVGERL
jgi:tripartite-type tricarboxylate transporter receptor subunit TctC